MKSVIGLPPENSFVKSSALTQGMSPPRASDTSIDKLTCAINEVTCPQRVGSRI